MNEMLGLLLVQIGGEAVVITQHVCTRVEAGGGGKVWLCGRGSGVEGGEEM